MARKHYCPHCKQEILVKLSEMKREDPSTPDRVICPSCGKGINVWQTNVTEEQIEEAIRKKALKDNERIAG